MSIRSFLPRHPLRAKMSGFALAEVALALMIIISVMTIMMKKFNDDLKREQAVAIGEGLQPLQAATIALITHNFDRIAHGQSLQYTNSADASVDIPGVPAATTPTIRVFNRVTQTWANIPVRQYDVPLAGMRDAGFLPGTFPDTGVNGLNYRVRIYHYNFNQGAAGISAPDIKGFSYLDGSLAADYDMVMIAQAAMSVGRDTGGYSPLPSPSTDILVGKNGVRFDNMVTGQPAGVLVALADFNGTGFDAFLRRDGSRPQSPGASQQGAFRFSDSVKVGTSCANPTVQGDLVVCNDLAVTRNANVGQDMAVTRNSRVGQDMTVDRDMTVSRNQTTSGNMTINGLTTANGITNTGQLTNNGNTSLNGTLGVTGLTTTNGIINTGQLTNNGNTNLNGTLGVTGLTTTSGITNNGLLTNNGNQKINGTSEVDYLKSLGKIDARGDIATEAWLYVAGEGHFGGDVYTTWSFRAWNGCFQKWTTGKNNPGSWQNKAC